MNNQDQILITQNGLAKLQKEHRQLKEDRRPVVVERLAGARSQGDLSENSEYQSAKEELVFIDGRITELEQVLTKTKVVDDRHNCCRKVGFGCQVTVYDGKNEKVFYLVGEWEANPSEAKISHQSPLGQSLIGKKIGDQVEIDAPVGKIIYTIKKIN